LKVIMQPQPAIKLNFRELHVILMAGLGGLLYGVDIGVIAAALPYIADTVRMTVAQTSFVVAAVLAGSSISSLAGGFLADRIGRKGAILTAAVMFVSSILAIGTAHAYAPLLAGRFIQGMSGGIVAVVVPLYLAEELTAERRGRGTAIFQFSLTLGIAIAAFVGSFCTRHVEAIIRNSVGHTELARMAEDHAWRSMFFALLYPGVAFFIVGAFLKESRYWTALRLQSTQKSPASAGKQRGPLKKCGTPFLSQSSANADDSRLRTRTSDSILQRKYVIPFLLACSVLACNQATGINSILSYAVVLFHEAGLSATQATQGDLAVKIVNCVFTLVAFALVDRKGRKFLLVLGTGGIVVSLFSAAILFRSIESISTNVKDEVQAAVRGGQLAVPVAAVRQAASIEGSTSSYTVSVSYTFGRGEKIVSVTNTDATAVIKIVPAPEDIPAASLIIIRARLTPTPPPFIGVGVLVSLSLFIACFAVGPGVVVWLTLSEIMPTRIRSMGMGFALLLNQAVSTASAAAFLPVVDRYGNSAMLILWATCTVGDLLIAVFLLPETKSKSLEEIERIFARRRESSGATGRG
jgi:SP family myo-inositol transporter-like MFS transporter 13